MIPFVQKYINNSVGESFRRKTPTNNGQRTAAGGTESSTKDKKIAFSFSEDVLREALESLRSSVQLNGQGRPLQGFRKGLIFDVRV